MRATDKQKEHGETSIKIVEERNTKIGAPPSVLPTVLQPQRSGGPQVHHVKRIVYSPSVACSTIASRVGTRSVRNDLLNCIRALIRSPSRSRRSPCW